MLDNLQWKTFSIFSLASQAMQAGGVVLCTGAEP